ncbi:MAG: hypothetical protein V7735_22465 [Photobacterium frigidiphilum]|uniref:hypothetical protein n=1 Tax=Photobacterium frigidiphilum TaxID=264736 RepID=UPI0030025C1A
MGFILYTTDPNLSATSVDALKSALKNSRGVGNFSFMLINILNDQEKGVQLIPVESIGSKDEFEGIKKISSQETIVVHHLLAGMSGIIQPEGASMGNPLQYNETYYENEVRPMQKLIMGVSAVLLKYLHIQFETLEAPSSV